MSLQPIDEIRSFAGRISDKLAHVETEEATKNALVLPFIKALGYNPFDPREVTPEFTADVGVKKGEKVDYAIRRDGEPIILFECKKYGENLEKQHTSQLYRYFSVTSARFGVLTDGVRYRFFSDLEEPNRMDSRPFLEVDMLDLTESILTELAKFTNSAFDLDSILSTANELKYTRAVEQIFAQQLMDPDHDFVRFFASQIHEGKLTQAVKEQFKAITKKALHQFIRGRVNDRLKTALAQEGSFATEPAEHETAEHEDGIITTQDELDGFFVVKAILREAIDVRRVALRDTKSYCGILLDDNNRKPICRLWFNRSQWYLGLFDASKQEERIPISTVDDIFGYAERLRDTVRQHDGEPVPMP